MEAAARALSRDAGAWPKSVYGSPHRPSVVEILRSRRRPRIWRIVPIPFAASALLGHFRAGALQAARVDHIPPQRARQTLPHAKCRPCRRLNYPRTGVYSMT